MTNKYSTYMTLEEKINKMTSIYESKNIIEDLERENIEIISIEELENIEKVNIGGIFMGDGVLLFLISDLYELIPELLDERVTQTYKTHAELLDYTPEELVKHFYPNVAMYRKSDKEIMDTAYGSQLQKKYRIMYKLVELSKIQDIPLPYNSITKLTGVEDEQTLDTYSAFTHFYLKKSMVFPIVTIKYESTQEQFVQSRLACRKTGEIVYEVNKSPGTVSDKWASYLVPLEDLKHFVLKTREPLEITASTADTLFSSDVGKMSGLKKNSRIDKEVCDFLDLDKLYTSGAFVRTNIEELEIAGLYFNK